MEVVYLLASSESRLLQKLTTTSMNLRIQKKELYPFHFYFRLE
jgi:hypothetical protein